MEKIRGISEREKRMLLILFSIGIIVLAYQFGYVKFNDKAKVISDNNKELNTLLLDLEEKQANKAHYLDEIQTMDEEITKMISNFPTSISQEKSTMFVVDLEKNVDIKVSTISFNELSVFYSNASGDNTEEEANTEVNSQDMESNTSKNISLKGYEGGLVLTYKTTYKGLKDAVDYITNEKAVHIRDISMAFDNTTGNLTGTITIPMYALDYNGLEDFIEEDKEIIIDNINTGTSNIFGTFEIPVNVE